MERRKRTLLALSIAMACVILLNAGCETATGSGALGMGLGGATGAAIGHQSGHKTEGALIGAVLGLAVGIGASLYGPRSSEAEAKYWAEMRNLGSGEAIYDRVQQRAAAAAASAGSK